MILIRREGKAMVRTRGILTAAMAVLGLSAADLKPGMPAPAFSAKDQSGATVSLSDFKGKSVVVLYFYPKDDTPGCTKEACSLRDGYDAIRKTGAVILGVSADDVASHAAFAKKYSLPFPLLADPGRAIIEAYGVRMPVLGFAKRVTFIIGKDGLIRDVVDDVKPAEHDKQVMESLGK
jgi:peroxiredoxin Q/BCP